MVSSEPENKSWKGQKGRPEKRWLDTIENGTRAVGVCAKGMWKIETNEDLRQSWGRSQIVGRKAEENNNNNKKIIVTFLCTF